MAVVKDKRTNLRHKLKQLYDSGLNDDSEEIVEILVALAQEEQKREQWKIENERRQHNYLPFCVELLKALTSSEKLPELTIKANERHLTKKRKAMNEKLASYALKK